MKKFLLLLILTTTSGFCAPPLQPYSEEEVSFVNPADGVKLEGTLTMPQYGSPFAAVVLLHGSAPMDRDETIFGHKPFLVLADYLTKQGIAVLRFDKRGAGKSGGDYAVATIEDFTGDALAAIDYLKTRREINGKKVGLIGHSEGGMTASLAASKSDSVAFIVMMACPSVNWEELMNEQVERMMRADQLNQETITFNKILVKEMFSIAKQQSDRTVAAAQMREALTRSLGILKEPERILVESYYGEIESQINLFNSTWFRHYLTYDPTVSLKQVKVPILALNGERDVQVSSKQNLPIINEALSEGECRDFTIMELPKLNHAFQTAGTGSIKEYGQIEETIAPSALKIMGDWILKRTR